MKAQLPRNTNPRTAEEVAQTLRDTLLFLQAQPAFEIREFSSVADFPIPVRLAIVRRPLVVLATARQQSDTTAGISAMVTNWTLSNVRGEPGLQINALDGLTHSVEYDVTLLIVGTA